MSGSTVQHPRKSDNSMEQLFAKATCTGNVCSIGLRQMGCTSELFGFCRWDCGPHFARRDQHQRVMYNGHKRVHAIKFHSLVLPNGLIANLYGPVGNYV